VAGKVDLLILDRDGVINLESAEFVKSAEEWQPLPGSIEAIGRLHRAGYTIAVASNQSGLARGLFDEPALDAMHAKMRALVADAGGFVDTIVYCPHVPDAGCDCRKPRPGLLHQLARHYRIELADVPVVGDSLRDLEAAVSVGARPILVRTGNGAQTETRLPDDWQDVEVYDDLAAVADALIRGR
jgi:D-glycero-D-manno-heptose 1,7-bisphosphate phosphatase